MGLKVHPLACGTTLDNQMWKPIMCTTFTQTCFTINQCTHTHSHSFALFFFVRLLFDSAVCDFKQHAHYDFWVSSPLPPAISPTKARPTSPLCSVHISGKTVLKGSDKWDPFFKYSTFNLVPHAQVAASASVLNLVPNKGTGDTQAQI